MKAHSLFDYAPAPRRRSLMIAALAAAWPAWGGANTAATVMIQVWKGPSCGCCDDWIRHLQSNGFEVKSNNDGNTGVRARIGMPLQYGSCHTALVGAYAIEGHVPAADIKRLLHEHPQAIGLAVPAMPVGSPGMDGPAYAGRKDPYDVLLVRRDGSTQVYRTYR